MPNCKTIAICNQKGGVGKTTTTMNLGIGLANKGKRVLLVDCDPQGDLTTCLGWQRVDEIPVTLATKMHEIIRDNETNPESGILHHNEGVDLIPSNTDLEGLEMYLVTVMSRENILKSYLNMVKSNYDYILIDCRPSLGMLTLNALTAADSVIIPVQAEKLFLVDEEIIKELEREIKAAIEKGYTTFISGMARGVDIWAAEIVLKLRKKNKELHLICASPYEGFETRWSQDWQKRYKKIIKKADYVKYVSPEYSPACFQIRNEYMVNHSNLLIAVYNGEAGGTRNTLNYAKNKDKEIVVIEG